MTQNSRSAPALGLSGLSATPTFLVVGVQVGTAHAARFATLKIPLDLLLHQDILDALDQRARAQLNAKWDQAVHEGLF